jgi:hypothetical protein
MRNICPAQLLADPFIQLLRQTHALLSGTFSSAFYPQPCLRHSTAIIYYNAGLFAPKSLTE